MTKPQETLECEMNEQVETFSFSTTIDLVEEGKWLLGVKSFEATSSVFIIADENSSFWMSTSSYWTPENGEELINKLNKLLELDLKIILSYISKKLTKGVLE